MTADPFRKWRVERAVKAAALALLAREQTVAEVVVVAADAVAADLTSRRRPWRASPSVATTLRKT
jgi:hypothetical protein